MQFKNNINALRAVAVLAVVLFHFKIDGFKGGFTGVDIFFVISGFLMTGIIFSGLQENRFSLLGFYASRANRIIPALFVLCMALMIFGFIYLPIQDYRSLLRTVKSSMLFSSNFLFASEGSYFDAPVHENWLLHTWSLSLEWQFYILYPVLLMAIFRVLGEKKVRATLVLLAIASLAASIYFTKTHSVFCFYMLPTRAWELIAGGLGYLFPLRTTRRAGYALEFLGMAVIMASLFFLSEQNHWPGYLATLPVLGALLFIYGNTNSVFSRNRFLQFVGKISYSTYLWHWPIVVLLYFCGLLENWAYVAPAVLLTFALGALSFHLVEKRRKKPRETAKVVLRYAALTAATVSTAAITAAVAKDHPGIRFASLEQGQPEYTSKLYTQDCFPNEFGAADCKLDSGEISVILFGDSHAQSTAAAVQLENRNAALGWALAGCPTLKNFAMDDKKQEKKCHSFIKEKLDILKNKYSGAPVILFSRSGIYLDPSRENRFRVYFNGKTNENGQSLESEFSKEYVNTVCEISENHPVYIVRPIPEMPFSTYKGLSLKARLFQSSSDISSPLERHEKRTRVANLAIDAAAAKCKAQIIDPIPYLCPNGQCMGSKNGESLYYDDNHLVDHGNVQLRGLFKGILRPL
ncbi:MAG: acyltransferase family protein [Candidatus Accumulibacter meliphilus]|jgi:peptidoglycan/LPS O-acetylase OafA/YrhL|uniref:acyltransferase family protein n=1 Tax=Candidatus Accumulibacter meliphilus TaxID=2211374 RepID=UPI002FC358B5